MTESTMRALQRIYASYGQSHAVYAGSGVALSSGRLKQLKHVVKSFFPPGKSARIADLGCGDATLLGVAASEGYTALVGVDVSPDMVQIARVRNNVDVVHSDSVEFLNATAPGSFDFLIAFDVIEHLDLPTLMKFTDAAFRALAPGGRLLLHVPNAHSSYVGTILFGDLTHFRAFTVNSIRQLAATCSFKSAGFFEDRPIPSGVVSLARLIMWWVIRHLIILRLAIETGHLRGHVLTLNMYAELNKGS